MSFVHYSDFMPWATSIPNSLGREYLSATIFATKLIQSHDHMILNYLPTFFKNTDKTEFHRKVKIINHLFSLTIYSIQ